MFAEPPRTRFDLHFNVAGFPVRISPWFWFMGLMLGLSSQGRGKYDLSVVLIWIVAMFISILVHELGHAFATRYFGWRSRIILYQLGGLATVESGEPWLPSYNEAESSPKSRILIALAGPIAGFLLAGILIGLLYAIPASGFGFRLGNPILGLGWTLSEAVPPRLAALISFMLYINIFWGLVNLLPVYPLDGGQIARELLSRKNPREGIERSLQVSVITGSLVAILGAIHFWRNGDFGAGLFIGLMFGLLAFSSYRALQMVRAHGGFDVYGGGGDYEHDDDDWWKK
jgi:stage IV sporulation protein FB